MLKKFVSERVQHWDKFLPYLLFAYREVPNESTGYSPFGLLYGRIIRGPLAVIKESRLEEQPSEKNLVSLVLEIRRRLATMQQVVKEHMKEAQRHRKVTMMSIVQDERCNSVIRLWCYCLLSEVSWRFTGKGHTRLERCWTMV